MITILDYKAGNLTSVKRALDHLGIASVITANPSEVESAERIIFPGVGNAESAMENMRSTGMDKALTAAFGRGVPILGICLGCQIILAGSEEGSTRCLGLMDGMSRKFALKGTSLKIPHMGWNALAIRRQHPLLAGFNAGDETYFVHSYYPQPSSDADVYAVTGYGIDFPSAIGHANLFAVQFHPEKSGAPGLRMLERFAVWDGGKC